MLLAGGDAGFHYREKLGALDAVQRPGPFDIQGGHPQITVVFQGGVDDLLQSFIGEELPPLQVGGNRSPLGGRGLFVGRTTGPGGGNRRFGPGVFRDHGAAAKANHHSHQ